MNEQVEKTEELVALEDEVIQLMDEEEPDEETVAEKLDDIYILGYEDAIKEMEGESAEDTPEETI